MECGEGSAHPCVVWRSIGTFYRTLSLVPRERLAEFYKTLSLFQSGKIACIAVRDDGQRIFFDRCVPKSEISAATTLRRYLPFRFCLPAAGFGSSRLLRSHSIASDARPARPPSHAHDGPGRPSQQGTEREPAKQQHRADFENGEDNERREGYQDAQRLLLLPPAPRASKSLSAHPGYDRLPHPMPRLRLCKNPVGKRPSLHAIRPSRDRRFSLQRRIKFTFRSVSMWISK
jgi:hypothetical protein